MFGTRRATSLVLTLILLALATGASATSFVPVGDRDLAAQADVIALATVTATQPGPADRLPTTDYVVEVEELVQGHLRGGTVVVRVPGGVGTDGIGLQVDGAPRLAIGEATLLFLRADGDGTYSILHLMLGAFHVRAAGGRLVAEQDLAGATSLRVGAKTEVEARNGARRDLGRLVDWLADRAAGVERAADYWVRVPNAARTAEAKAYSHFATSDGVPARWFAFQSVGYVGWRVQAGGMPGLGFDATVAAVQTAASAWTSDATSAIEYGYDGSTDAIGGLSSSDRVNGFVFGDPHETIAGKFDCKKGGALAIGGAWFSSATRDYRGKAYHEILEADVIVNDGAECFLAGNPSGAAEVFAHELGHTLGFGHATDPQALMRAQHHDDGRGARLGDDDRLGASVVYGDGSYQPAPTGPDPDGAQPFTVVVNAATQTTVELSWTQPPAEAASFRVDLLGKKGTFRVLAIVPGGDTSVTIGGLKKNQCLTLRITALRADGTVAGASNTLKVRTKK